MLTEEVTAGGIRTTPDNKKKLARESLAYNFKKEAQFVELFGDFFDRVGIDRDTRQAVATEQSMEEERKDSRPLQNFKEALAQSARGKPYQQVMTMQEFDEQLRLM